ncbi:Oidioi.mRNA.OKI2018_I69.PAR.g12346.t1.cds [Oikopleura dioica]|uniref:Probable RNA-binding protein EIF1AD n=1 Tax=Oikopleura dioica TaxID=34765 RepID=A0ABN7S793_OIKDI|nr:Oidioi.mRNA.OKI2018_I69.PAR.g12346.t1.cds [Oikopleura dioica]
MSALTKKKYVMAEADEEIDKLTSLQSIQRVLSSPGSYLFQIENQFGERSLASLPQKFRNTIWVKRNTYVICEPIFEGEKVKYEIVRVLQPDNIKQLKKMKQFPLQFENDSRHPGGDGQNCTDTVNNKEELDGSEGEEDSDDDLPMIMNRIQVEYSDSSSDNVAPRVSVSTTIVGFASTEIFQRESFKGSFNKSFSINNAVFGCHAKCQKSQQFSTTKPKPTRIRPGALPDPETLYDELEASRKEIATQKQLINAQKTRNQRLEQELKSRETELEKIYSGDNGRESSTKNDQLRCKIIRLERDLRQKDVDLGKLQFEMKTTDVNELKIALKGRVLSNYLSDISTFGPPTKKRKKEPSRRERKAQIAGLKKAIQVSGKECETLRIENEKYRTQLETLRKTDLDAKLKMKNENEYLKTQLRKSRKENPSATLAGPIVKQGDHSEKLKSENEFLRQKVDKMSDELESLHQQLENASQRDSADQQNH